MAEKQEVTFCVSVCVDVALHEGPDSWEVVWPFMNHRGSTCCWQTASMRPVCVPCRDLFGPEAGEWRGPVPRSRGGPVPGLLGHRV